MLKKSTYAITLILLFIIGTSAVLYTHIPLNAFVPPPGSTGVMPGVTCGNNGTGCHSDNTVNTLGGNITVSGLPTVYTPGAVYNFSLTITHGAADRKRWGFSITARKSTDATTAIGTFSTTNPNAALNAFDPTELSHKNAPITPVQNSFTFTNLTWTAPAAGNGSVTFYYAGNAADGTGNGSAGDFIYRASTRSGALPITLYSFNASVKKSSVQLSWQTAQEINSDYFTIQKSTDNRQFNDIGKVNASGNSSVAKNYSFTDDNPAYFENPIYYRLAMVDKDGSKTYSTIENVVLKATSTYIKGIYPNPLKAGSTLHVNFVSKENELVFLRLIDNEGRLIKRTEINAQKGNNILDVKMPESAAGSYKLVLKSSAGSFQKSLMIR